jgi:CubicO group peptidase (beta-lactamase class C family)
MACGLAESLPEPDMQAIERAERYSDPMEHRWGQRVSVEAPVRLYLDDAALGRGLLRNISTSGALIETSLQIPVFANLVVALPTIGEASPQIHELAASVVRRVPAGVAVEWRDMACPAIVALIERVTGKHVADLLEDQAFAERRA